MSGDLQGIAGKQLIELPVLEAEVLAAVKPVFRMGDMPLCNLMSLIALCSATSESRRA